MKIALLITTVLAIASCSNTGTNSAAAIDPAAARDLIAAKAVVLDVREPDEYASGHLEAAKNIPVDTVSENLAEIERLVGGDKTKPIVVYCASGVRAATAKATLEAHGFTHVVDGGGYRDLK